MLRLNGLGVLNLLGHIETFSSLILHRNFRMRAHKNRRKKRPFLSRLKTAKK